MATPAQRSSAARYAVNTSWARTPNRTERTAPGHAASPVSYEYWFKKITDEGQVREQDIPAAAKSAHRAYMQGLARKGQEKRRKTAEAAKKSRTTAA
jgi:hypothetical protein